MLLDAYVAYFSASEFNILTAKTGLQALEVASSAHPDIIILDLLLPEMDGLTALVKLKEGSETADIPVIIVSNSDKQSDSVARTMSKLYLVKSEFTMREIHDRVVSILNS